MTYTDEFYQAETEVAARSAAIVLPVILKLTDAHTVIDVGCGTGAWAAEAEQQGCYAVGIDWHVPQHLRVLTNYRHLDLTVMVPRCAGFDLAICLEVAEHLPPAAGPRLIDGLRQAKAVLFSAATPGQPGVGHINCRPHQYWHDLFAQYEFTPAYVGPLFSEPVADFYRRNMYLYRRQA